MDQPRNANQPDNLKSVEPRDADASPVADNAPPLTPAAWLMNNAIYLIILGGLVGVIWYNLGLEGVWSVAKVVFGLGFVIFIHELGHFLAAKWCDVHVQTFSIGFGPALPGCSFQRGETTYKIAVLPLGGFVNMVGEGLETDEDEDYPRSFKNKTVGQRMLIISAGVIMNVLLGCVLFITVYYYHGVMETPAIVGRVDAGSPLWEKGIPTGALITELGGIHNPVFKNLRVKVILSSAGEKLPFTFQSYGPNGTPEGERTVDLLPRKDDNDKNPVVGVAPADQLRLFPKPKQDYGILPVLPESPSVAARPVPLMPDEVIVATTDPDHPDRIKELKHDLTAGSFDYLDFARRLRSLKGKKMVVQCRRKPSVLAADLVGLLSSPLAQGPLLAPTALLRLTVERDVPLEGFQWNDAILGCTDVQDARSYDPFRVSELPRDPRHDSGDKRDPFVFQNRLRLLAGLPMVIQVRRGDPNNDALRENSTAGPVANLFVPPAYHFTFGLRMKMGKVAGIRDGSAAAQANVNKGDELIKIVMTDEHGKTLHAWEELDPERLPGQMAEVAAKHGGVKKVIMTVRREPSEPNQPPKDIACDPVDWDQRWDNDEEVPFSVNAPLAIPQLGVAYWVLSQVVEVKPDSPAARAGLKKDDTIKEYRIKTLSRLKKGPDWDDWYKLESERNGVTVYDRWAMPFWSMQFAEYKEMQVKINRPGEDVKDAFTLTPTEDTTWPLVSRGIRLQGDYKLHKADSFGGALVIGARETRDMIVIMYLQLRSLLTGRVSFKQAGGPIAMGVLGFFHAESGNFELLMFLGMISINLAVVNFLPIPILDGGHMVFLLYEKLRGRPPTERIRIVATYIGLAMIAFLMILVFYQDFQNYVRKMFGI